MVLNNRKNRNLFYNPAPNAEFINPLANPEEGPPAGNPDGHSPVPLEAGPEDISTFFFVSNDHNRNIRIDNSIIRNKTGGSWYPVYPEISMHEATQYVVTNSIIE